MQRIGPYAIERELARGSTAVVFRATDPATGQPLAIKLFQPGANVTRAEREARVLTRLRHKNVIALRECGVEQGRLYMVMDLVDGESLQARLNRGAPPSPREALAIARDVARALEAAHALGILHRDVKPDNVLLGRDGRVYLGDFGLARIEEEAGLSLSGQMMGTPGYWPPEQAAGDRKKIGTASDIYGLGATLHAALTGHPPFEAENLVEAMAAAMRRAPQPPSATVPGIPPVVDALVLRCLEKEPEARPPSAEVLAVQLEHCLRGEVAVSGGRARRVLGALAALALLAGATLVLLLLGRDPSSATPAVPAPAARSDVPSEAYVHHNAGRWPEAERAYEAWLELHPEDAASRAQLGHTRQQQGRPAEAEADFRRALELDPRLRIGLKRFGDLLYHQRRYAESLAFYQRALDLAPTDGTLLHQRAVVHDAMGDRDAAERDYSAALQAKPKGFETLLQRARLRSRRGDHTAALADLDRAEPLDPTNPLLIERRSQVLAASGDLTGALAVLDTAEPGTPEARAGFDLGRATLLLYLGEHQKAFDLAQSVIDRTAGGVRVAMAVDSSIGVRAFAAYLLGREEEASALFAEAERTLEPRVSWAMWRAAFFGAGPDLARYPRGPAWPGPLLRYLLGELPAQELAGLSSTPEQRCDSEAIQGVVLEVQNQQLDEARRHYQASVDTGEDTRLGYMWARTRLEATRR